MTELIKVEKRNGKQVVSARELYLSLGYDPSNYSRWSKSNIVDNPYAIENEDWSLVINDELVNQQVNPSKDYAICITMAKKIAMMAKTDIGNKIRDYFLECEKKASSIILPDFTNPAEAAIAWAEQYKAKEEALLEAKKQKEHVLRLTHDAKTYTTSEIARELNLKSATQLNKILETENIQYKLNGTWLLYSNYADKDFVSIKQTTLDNGKIIYDRRWTGSGRDFIINLLKND